MPKRDIFSGKPYFKLRCVETGRGCPHHCNFCSIMASTFSKYIPRSIDDILTEITGCPDKNIFFVDDNIVGNRSNALRLFREVSRLKVNWISQGSLSLARDPELLDLMAASGCKGLLIGFESFKKETLDLMEKPINASMGDYREWVRRIHEHGIGIYGTFIFGYDTDTAHDFMEAAERAIEMGLFIASFNHLIPFPGTPIYQQYKNEHRFTDEQWWLSPTYRFGDVPYTPENVTAKELKEICLKTRHRFYSLPATFHRMLANLHSPAHLATFLTLNVLLRKEIDQRNNLPLGNESVRPKPFHLDLITKEEVESNEPIRI